MRRRAQDRDRLRRQLRHELLAPRLERRRVGRQDGIVEARGSAAAQERGRPRQFEIELRARLRMQFTEPPRSRGSTLGDERPRRRRRAGRAARRAGTDCGRTTAAMRSRCVFRSRRTGTPEAASSRMSAPDSSTLARNASQTASPTGIPRKTTLGIRSSSRCSSPSRSAEHVLVGERLVLVGRVRLGDERVDRRHDLGDAAERRPSSTAISCSSLDQPHDVAHVLLRLRGQPDLEVELQAREAAREDEARLLVEHRVGDLLVDVAPQPLVAGLGRDRQRLLALPREHLEDRVLDRVDLDGGERDVVLELRQALEDRDDLGVVADRGGDQARAVRQRPRLARDLQDRRRPGTA